MAAWLFVTHGGTSAALWGARTLGPGRLLATTTTTTVPAAVATTLARVTTRTLAASAATAATWAGGLAVAYALQHLGACGFGCGLHHVAARGFTGTAPDGLATHGNGLCLFTRFRAKAFDHLDFDVLLSETLDVLHEAFFIQTHQVDRGTVGTSAASAANAVHVVFAHVRDFVVHHMR